VDLTLSAADEAFRTEVRAFMQTAVTPETREKVRRGTLVEADERDEYVRALYERGWMAPMWPKEFGGAAWTPIQRLIFDQEASAAWAPGAMAPGIFMLGPILIAFGNEEQKAYYLPRTLSREIRWAQGYSEPGSGSDLASLQTRAVRDGDEYIINGQKIWITQADHSDMMFTLVRTSTEEKKQQGISFLLIDLHAPGITIRPITLLNNAAEVCEVFFDGVRVPVKNLVGTEGEGWTYATRLLEHERSTVGNVNRARAALARIREVAAEQYTGAGTLLDDATFAEKLARLEIRLQAATFMQLRVVAEATAGGRPGPASSLLKIIGTEIAQEITYLAMSATGYAAVDKDSRETTSYFDNRKLSIFSGSNEIQRNIVAKRILGL
jgi:alkylation response protein AidB-like acyl-CoA dehydrogenase